MRTARQYGLPGPHGGAVLGHRLRMVVDHVLEPLEVAVGLSDAAARRVENRRVAHRAADGRQREHLPLRRVGRQREAPRGWLGHAGQAATYAYRSAICFSLNCGNDGMMPHGFCTA